MSEMRLAAAVFISLFIVIIYSYLVGVLSSVSVRRDLNTVIIMTTAGFNMYNNNFIHLDKRIKALENKGKIFSGYGEAL